MKGRYSSMPRYFHRYFHGYFHGIFAIPFEPVEGPLNLLEDLSSETLLKAPVCAAYVTSPDAPVCAAYVISPDAPVCAAYVTSPDALVLTIG